MMSENFVYVLYTKLHGFTSQKKNLIVTAVINAVTYQMARITQSTQLCFITKRVFVVIKTLHVLTRGGHYRA